MFRCNPAVACIEQQCDALEARIAFSKRLRVDGKGMEANFQDLSIEYLQARDLSWDWFMGRDLGAPSQFNLMSECNWCFYF